MKARASKLMRAYISRLPNGEFEAVDWLDNDGIIYDPLKIKIKLKISGEKMTWILVIRLPRVLVLLNFSVKNGGGMLLL
ncbi:MAG: hypothetical protein CM15mP62_30890 [Rhodospirillaceae bacterium]|nr:MAG: hypothetical protein CM15mP62_30890 [Rhodospirillaceae bacterium]